MFFFCFFIVMEVCYGKYGCFFDDLFFDNLFIVFLLDFEMIGIKFVLYISDNVLQKEILDIDNNVLIINFRFDLLFKVKFIIYGFIQNGQIVWVNEMVWELLRKEKLNVIVVDWGLGFSVLNLNLYYVVVGNICFVGV